MCDLQVISQSMVLNNFLVRLSPSSRRYGIKKICRDCKPPWPLSGANFMATKGRFTKKNYLDGHSD